jgi:hypothetical protein
MSTDQKAFTAYWTLTCPECGHQTKEMMPTESCQFFYEYPGSNAMLWPKVGDFFVFCSLGEAQLRANSRDRPDFERQGARNKFRPSKPRHFKKLQGAADRGHAMLYTKARMAVARAATPGGIDHRPMWCRVNRNPGPGSLSDSG